MSLRQFEERRVFHAKHRHHQRPVKKVVAHLAGGLGNQRAAVAGGTVQRAAFHTRRVLVGNVLGVWDRWSTARLRGGLQCGGLAAPSRRGCLRRPACRCRAGCRSAPRRARFRRRCVRGWNWPDSRSAGRASAPGDARGCAAAHTRRRGTGAGCCASAAKGRSPSPVGDPRRHCRTRRIEEGTCANLPSVGYEVEYRKSSLVRLAKLDSGTRARIVAKVAAVGEQPMAPNPNIKPLTGVAGHRLRVGDWRVLFELDHGNRRLVVRDIETRGDAYRRRR